MLIKNVPTDKQSLKVIRMTGFAELGFNSVTLRHSFIAVIASNKRVSRVSTWGARLELRSFEYRNNAVCLSDAAVK